SRLRQASPPVLARIERERLVLDPRTVAPSEDQAVVRALREAVSGS
ncbi:MAG: hypothetical protein IIC87_08045, partial [Chloroflexi bacterium]|nr:hypothetical protein [Chloroflexota bacterium]